jgi:alpha-beta hydrolase superfamily lysophospholipase
MSRERAVAFVTDGLNLAGVLHLPDRPPLAIIIGCHGLLADKNSPKQLDMSKWCTANGLAYFRFDHRGCGASEGIFDEQTTLANRKTDLIAAVQAAVNAVALKVPIGLFGSSLGGTVCLAASQQLNPFAMVTLAAPVQTKSIRMPEGSPESLIDDVVGNRLMFDIRADIRATHHLLVIHGSADGTVPVENADAIYRLATHPKKRVILSGADHRISDLSLRREFIENAVRWYIACYREQFR